MLRHACNLKRIIVLGGWGVILSAALLTSGPGAAQPLAAGYAHTCALGGNGRLICWGANDSGQLGDGTTTNRPTPTAPVGILSIGTTTGIYIDLSTTNFPQPYNVVGQTVGITHVAGGHAHSCAIDFHRQVNCWGNNSQGQLGDGTTTSRGIATPVAR
jgi:alpha-tubulin suppressor-like RCC1 family protein